MVRLVKRMTTSGWRPSAPTEAGRAYHERVAAILAEMRDARTSERQGRLIDHDDAGSMEKKKREGYF